ncbi:WD40 repeat domain-containing serine/threonine protein kinase [Thermoactinospora rubra]|uniref:WD40 repeat domain-containing serine/threonine protein kinase n=1 Tax=Thermoactinospora rubra TaxID=1088767 RepID=UPI000A11A30F|nr:WD40 repeat domain-containing serine/threonine protein kinase [Thermoactinospora rubra]
MSQFAPLKQADPERLGDYELLGRLGEGGQGVVYLATAPGGGKVAVKWLRAELAGDEVSISRFLREVQVAERVAPFCTAAVLAKGVAQERPYIVSEYIEGPSLYAIVQEKGPRTGNGLHRLAVGTATALAAIHQAGIVHRDFKPANVLLAADGPRVIDFGIARALNANATITNMPVGTPSYMAPEQIMGELVGPAADMFSWANTMVYAATGKAPFGNDTMHAVINRVLNHEPDLGRLDGPLREVVESCLAKDPAARPTAEQVIMRLLRHPTLGSPIPLQEAAAAATGPPLTPMPGLAPPPGQPAAPPPTTQPAAGQPPFTQPPVAPAPTTQPPQGPPARPPHAPAQPYRRPGGKRGRTGLVVGAAAAFAVVLAAGLIVITAPWKHLPWQRAATPAPTPTRPQSTHTATPAVTPVRLPGGEITLFESPSDPVRLTSYEVRKDEEWVDYARASLTGRFAAYPGHWESLVSPDGRYLAGRARNYTPDGYDPVIVTDRETGARFTVKTVRKPLGASVRAWSRDGRRILLNVERDVGGVWSHLGFVVVDVRTRKATVVRVKDARGLSAFGWDGSQNGVVSWDARARALRFFDLRGTPTRELKGLGELPSGTDRLFSPSGRQFATTCDDGATCIWDTRSGDRLRRFASDCDKVIGWFDEQHLYCWELDNGRGYEVQVVGFDGRLVRRLLQSGKGLSVSPVFTPAR